MVRVNDLVDEIETCKKQINETSSPIRKQQLARHLHKLNRELVIYGGILCRDK